MSHLLRVILSRRRLTANVTNPSTNSIIAMASTTLEPEFRAQYRAKLLCFRKNEFIDQETSSQIGDKLGMRLIDIGVTEVEIDVDEEMKRYKEQRRVVKMLFDSVEEAGVRVIGADKLDNLG